MWNKFFGHLKTVLTHKWWVLYYSFQAGIPWQGFMHDWSKFHPIEFFEGVKYYNGKISPIDVCKKENGISLAWLHHKGRNPHHYEYWIDYLDKGGIPHEIPVKYVKELICDWIAAGRTYYGKDFTFEKEFNYVQTKLHISKINNRTAKYIYNVFWKMANTYDTLKYTLAIEDFWYKNNYDR